MKHTLLIEKIPWGGVPACFYKGLFQSRGLLLRVRLPLRPLRARPLRD